MSLLDAIILGIVEGLTVYLPVSSTGHLILAARLLGLEGEDAVKSFEIVIQAGAILAVLGLYQERVVSMLRGIVGRDPAGRRLLVNLAVAVLPAVVLGLAFREAIKSYLFWWAPVALALAGGGVVILLFEPLRRRRMEDGKSIEDLTAREALVVGACQCLALWPGTSRSLVTILAGLGVGLSPAAAAELSFLLALPTLGGATLLEASQDGAAMLDAIGPANLAAGVLTSLAAATLAVRWFVHWLGTRGLAPFGYYRIVVALAFAASFAVGAL